MNRYILRLVGLLDNRRILYPRNPAHTIHVGSYWTTDLARAHLHDKRQADESATSLLDWAVAPRWELTAVSVD